MPLVPMRILLDHAAEHGYGLAAFNVNNMEQFQAIMEAARETESPVIVQASRGARSYSQDNYLRHLMLAAAELYQQIPIAMHQDHGNSPTTCQSAIDNGFTSVMMDGSLKEIQRGIKHGVRKINVDTDCRMAITGAIRKVLAEAPEKFDPRDYLKPSREAMKKVCAERMVQFGQAGNARKVPLVTLAEMAGRYAKS